MPIFNYLYLYNLKRLTITKLITSVLLVDCIKETSTTPWINGGKL